MATRLDRFLSIGRSLASNPRIGYIWDSQHWSLATVKRRLGANCWTSWNAIMIHVAEAEGLDYDSIFGTVAGHRYLALKQPYRDDVLDFRGAAVISPDQDGSQDKSHVGMTTGHDGEFTHCHDSGWNAGMTVDRNAEVSNRRWLGTPGWPGWDGYVSVGYWPRIGVHLDPERIEDEAREGNPGGILARLHALWYSHPALLAAYFSSVARRYGLPEILPVACSMREIGPSAWTPGDLLWREVYGWSVRVDHNSLGPFQQQSPLPVAGEAPLVQRDVLIGNRRLNKPDHRSVPKDVEGLRELARKTDEVPEEALSLAGPRSGLGVGGTGAWYWGRPEQVMDPVYSVHRFCREAVKYRGKYGGQRVTPQLLTNWIADVQRPRADLRGAYAEFADAAAMLVDLGWSAIPNDARPPERRSPHGVFIAA